MSSTIDEARLAGTAGVEAGVRPQQGAPKGTGRGGTIEAGLVPQDVGPEFLTNWELRRDEAIGKIDAIERSLGGKSGTADQVLQRIDHALALAIVIAQIAAARGDVALAESIAARADKLVNQTPAAATALGNAIAAANSNNLDALKRHYGGLRQRIDSIVAKARNFVSLVETARRVSEVVQPSTSVDRISRTAEALLNAIGPLLAEEAEKPTRHYKPTDVVS